LRIEQSSKDVQRDDIVFYECEYEVV